MPKPSQVVGLSYWLSRVRKAKSRWEQSLEVVEPLLWRVQRRRGRGEKCSPSPLAHSTIAVPQDTKPSPGYL